MSSNKNNTGEEVDLGSLFVIIGKGFSKLFNFIGNIFKGIFHFLIQTLLFVKKHLLKLFIAGLIGVVIGGVFEYNKEKKYASDLLLQPNFNSARQLYNNINYYNDLVSQKKTEILSNTFEISTENASSLKSFQIEPIITDNDVLSAYDDLILSVDTLTVKSYSFAQFKRMFTKYDYKIHKVKVESTKNNVFSSLDDVIISSIVENEFFNKLKILTNENLNRTDSLLRKNLTQIDSLNTTYIKVMLDEANKESSGTNIDLGGERRTSKELELFESTRKVNKDLKKTIEDKAEMSEVVNVISNFQPIGYEVKEIRKNHIFLFGVLSLVLMLLFLLLKNLNKYLENYQK